MTTQWLIEQVEATDTGSHVVYWRANNGPATAYGTVTVEGLTIGPKTTEADVIAKTKEALNAYVPTLDEHGNPVPPAPGAQTARTDAIEAALVKQAAELANPKPKTVTLPWKQVA